MIREYTSEDNQYDKLVEEIRKKDKEIERLKSALKRKYPNRNTDLMLKYEFLDIACAGYKLIADKVIGIDKENKRLKSIIGRSSDQIDNIIKTIPTTWFEEQRLKSIKDILLEVEQ